MYKIEHHEESIVITISEVDNFSDYRLINLLDYVSYFTTVGLEENSFSVEDKEICDLHYKFKEHVKIKKEANGSITRRRMIEDGESLNEVIIFKDCKAEVLPLTALLSALKGVFRDMTSQTIIISDCKFDYVECSEDLQDFVITNSKIGSILNPANRIASTVLVESKIGCYSSLFLFTEDLNSETRCRVNFSDLSEISAIKNFSSLETYTCTISIYRCNVPIILAGADLYRSYNIENTQNTLYLYSMAVCSAATGDGYLPKDYYFNELLPIIHTNMLKEVHDYYKQNIITVNPYHSYFDDY